MKNTFKYILIAFITTFIGLVGVNAKECTYDDGSTTVVVTTHYTALGSAHAKLTKYNGKKVGINGNDEDLFAANGKTWNVDACPGYVLVYKNVSTKIWGVDTKAEAQKLADAKKYNSKKYSVLSSSDSSSLSQPGVENADLTCAYKDKGNHTLTCSISNGDSYSKCTVDGGITLEKNARLPIDSFIGDSVLKCPKTIYYDVSANQTTHWDNFTTSASAAKNKNSISLLDNTSPVKYDSDSLIRCTYEGGTDGVGLKINIDTEAKTLVGDNASSCKDVVLKFGYEEYEKAQKNSYKCIDTIYMKRTYEPANERTCEYSLTQDNDGAIQYDAIKFTTKAGIGNADGQNVIMDNIASDRDYADGCNADSKTIRLLKSIYTFIRYLIPILIIGLSIVDFIKVVANGEEKAFKGVWNNLVKRIIIGVIILIIPAILAALIRISGVINVYGIDDNNIFCIFT